MAAAGEGEPVAGASDACAPGWVRDAGGRIRRETIHSMLRRLPGWNYKKPWIYQITLVCANRGQAPLGAGLGEARLWTEGFQDTILFHEGQLDNMFHYLADNARRRAIKALWPDLFRVVRRLGVTCVSRRKDGTPRLLAPVAWPYTPGEKPMTRLDAVAMNRLCQLLAGEDAAEINYHGMKPNDIDSLARAAVTETPHL